MGRGSVINDDSWPISRDDIILGRATMRPVNSMGSFSAWMRGYPVPWGSLDSCSVSQRSENPRDKGVTGIYVSQPRSVVVGV